MSAEEKHKIAEIDQYLDELAERIVKEMREALGGEITRAQLCTLIDYIFKHVGTNFGDVIAVLEFVKFKMMMDAHVATRVVYIAQP